MHRRRFLALAAVSGVAAAGGYGCAVEPGRVVVTRHPLGAPANSGGQRLRLVQLSDLHLRHLDAHARSIAEAVAALAPDVLLLTGDVVDEPAGLPALDAFLDLLPPGVPAFAILGNWEHWGGVRTEDLRAVYGAHGARLLVNEAIPLRHAGGAVQLVGLDDQLGGTPDFFSAVAPLPPSPNRLLLAHCPVYRDRLLVELAARDRLAETPAYALSGHTHGGQVAFAGFAPVRPVGSGPYVSGWYGGRLPMYVSRGLGTSVLPLRFGAPPEVALFDWFLPT